MSILFVEGVSIVYNLYSLGLFLFQCYVLEIKWKKMLFCFPNQYGLREKHSTNQAILKLSG